MSNRIQHWDDAVNKWIVADVGTRYYLIHKLGKDMHGHMTFELVQLPSDPGYPARYHKSWALNTRKSYTYHDATDDEMRLALRVVFIES